MRLAGLPIALGLILLANLVALAGVWRNSAGQADATLDLTERELRLGPIRDEDTGISLRLSWNVSGAPEFYLQATWLGKAKLEELGFDCSVPPSNPSAELFYRKARRRQTYAVLEQEGPAWAQWIAAEQKRLEAMAQEVARQEKTPRDLESARNGFEISRRTMSRLFVVDLGNDPASLRERHPDRSRFALTPAVVRLSLNTYPPDRPELVGHISEILIDEIHVPRGRRAYLDRIREEELRQRDSASAAPQSTWLPGEAQGPRYRVTLGFGRRYEPWVDSVDPLEPVPESPLLPAPAGVDTGAPRR